MTTLPRFSDVSQALQTLSSLGTAGESHGLLCALLSFNNQIRETAWVDSLLSSHIEPSDSTGQKAYALLSLLFRTTAKTFAEQDFNLSLLLPDDDLPLTERIDAIAEWCQGYLTGLHLMGLKLDNPDLSADLKEALQDLLAISQIELTAEDEADPQSEVHLMELTEHVKAAVLLVASELKEALAYRDSKTVH